MKPHKLSIGLDFGSDSVRALLVDIEDGTAVSSHVVNYPRWSDGAFSDAALLQFRQHPLDYLESMTAAIRGALREADPKQVAAIGVDTTGSTPCAIDASGMPLSLAPEFVDDPDAMFLLWKDHTALPEAEEINAFIRQRELPYNRFGGGTYSCEWFFAKVLHVLRRNPPVAAAAASWVEHCDWIPALLTGTAAPAALRRSRCAAGHKAMWNAEWQGFPPEEFFAALDPQLAALRRTLAAETFTCDVPAGRLTPEWAEKLGLSPEVVVACGALDGHLGAVGAQIRPGDFVMVCGTSTSDFAVVPRLDRCIDGICGQVDGSVLPGLTGVETGQSAFGDVYAWFKRLLAYGGGKVELAQLEKEAAALPPGASGVYALDWFNGRRTPHANPLMTGALFGMNLGSTAPMLYRALVESTVFGARAIIDHLKANGIPVEAVITTGGISRKSPFIMQMCADLFGGEVKVAASDQTCALGAAMAGATAAGFFPGIAEAAAAMGAGFDAVYAPDAERGALYEPLYRRYLRCGAVMEKFAMETPR